MAVELQSKDQEKEPGPSDSSPPQRSVWFMLSERQKWAVGIKVVFCSFLLVCVVAVGMLLAVVSQKGNFDANDKDIKPTVGEGAIGEGIITSDDDTIIGKVQDVLYNKRRRSTEIAFDADQTLLSSRTEYLEQSATDVDVPTLEISLLTISETRGYFRSDSSQSFISDLITASIPTLESSSVEDLEYNDLATSAGYLWKSRESLMTRNLQSSAIRPTETVPETMIMMTPDLTTLEDSISETSVDTPSSFFTEFSDTREAFDRSSETAEAMDENIYKSMIATDIAYDTESALLAENLVKKMVKRYARNDNSKTTECRERRVSLCNGILPYNHTTLPNIVGDTNDIAVNRTMPFFKLITKSSCNRRIRQLVCLIIEPMCYNNRPLPPCRKFCRVALEGCGEYIPATLSLSSVFQCERYPDSSNPTVCTNLARGNACFSDEFQCPDATCIPNHWKCDGVRDCIFASDEANCAGVSSACTSEEFMCDRKCVPSTWKCDGDRDCLDGTDERDCPTEPSCGLDRFRCADESGCIPKRWVCDGKAECRDGSDEKGCAQRDCAQGDFRCSNGICIPSVWRCDGQDDCRDNSDEINCLSHNSDTSPAAYSRRIGFRIY